ncbi:unnamed protein product [Chondrus crispus]|uniref:Phosphatidic acid phosphatase type 2/haloperoxidase domain-containing protein n=1 Tax=Chondrus crispus TaxID=2769 RepID=R7QBQ8_CHOCR|nr:unnamed protein product [Chondrus crispus]CDF35937.1 unnamed protein product [Chondrus crispus]|eukprot:XP_005715756.1 unnamed protein product [Chondrus crispus]
MNIVTRIPLLALEVSGHGVPWLAIPILLFLCKTHLSATSAALMLNFLALTVLDLLVILILKPLFRRSRPVYNTGIGHVTLHAVDQFSFPSGHSTRGGFLSSFVCYSQYYYSAGLVSWAVSPIFTAFAIVWGLAICMSRVALGRHHILDVVAGCMLGLSYVYAWQHFWIGEVMASDLRNDLRSTFFSTAVTYFPKMASGFEYPSS